MVDSPSVDALSEPVRAAAADLRARLVDRYGERLRDMRLFGSYARGQARAESDVDVLVVIEELLHQERRTVFDLAEEVYEEHLVPISVPALSTAEWDHLKAREYLIASDIEHEGLAI
jgi:predicted nucleotidyltransferase